MLWPITVVVTRLLNYHQFYGRPRHFSRGRGHVTCSMARVAGGASLAGGFGLDDDDGWFNDGWYDDTMEMELQEVQEQQEQERGYEDYGSTTGYHDCDRYIKLLFDGTEVTSVPTDCSDLPSPSSSSSSPPIPRKLMQVNCTVYNPLSLLQAGRLLDCVSTLQSDVIGFVGTRYRQSGDETTVYERMHGFTFFHFGYNRKKGNRHAGVTLAFRNKVFSKNHFVATGTTGDKMLQGRVGVVHTRSSQSENVWIVAYLPPCTGTVANRKMVCAIFNYIRRIVLKLPARASGVYSYESNLPPLSTHELLWHLHHSHAQGGRRYTIT